MSKIDFRMTHAEALDLVRKLTPREREVAELFAMGVPRADICRRLGIAMKTLDVYGCNIRHKLRTHLTAGIARVWFATCEWEQS